MSETILDLDKAIHPDGFVDYYAVLSSESSAPTADLQESINGLYQEAQINRDHRTPARRRDYQTLLEILPQARIILLDEARRKRYDAYRHAVEMELPRMPYNEFVTGLVREKEAVDTRSDILTIRDLSRLRLPNPDEVPDESATPEPVSVPEVTAPAPTLKESIEAAPVKERVSRAEKPAEVPATSPTLGEEGPISGEQRFSIQAIVGGLIIMAGMIAALPPLVGVPMVPAVILALVCAGVVVYVFSLTGQVIEA